MTSSVYLVLSEFHTEQDLFSFFVYTNVKGPPLSWSRGALLVFVEGFPLLGGVLSGVLRRL